MTKTYYEKNTIQTSSQMSIGFWNAQVTFKLQPSWSHPFWQVYLQHFCKCWHLCGHSGQHDQNILSEKCNPHLKLDDSRVLECAQVTFKLQPRWSHPLWQVYLQYFCTNLHLCEHSGHHDQNMLSIKHNPNLNFYDSRVLECSGCI